MQPLLQLLRWENTINAILQTELHLNREATTKLMDANPALLRKSWHRQLSARDTADQLIALNQKEKSRHD